MTNISGKKKAREEAVKKTARIAKSVLGSCDVLRPYLLTEEESNTPKVKYY